MKALLFSDFCTTKKGLVRNALVILVVVFPIIALSNAGGEGAPGVFAASMVVMMLVIYGVKDLFGTDELQGWEAFRLTLPTSARAVVRSRYAYVACMTCVACMVGAAAGFAIERLIPLFGGVLTVPRDSATIAASALAAGFFALLYLAIELPILFRFGMSRSRIAFAMPFFLFLLFTVEAVRRPIMQAINALERLAISMGTPAPLFVGAAVLILLCYLVSMRISEHLYERREF